MLSILLQAPQFRINALISLPETTIYNSDALLDSLKAKVQERIGYSDKFKIVCESKSEDDITDISVAHFQEQGGVYHVLMLDGANVFHPDVFVDFVQQNSPQFTSLQSQMDNMQKSLSDLSVLTRNLKIPFKTQTLQFKTFKTLTRAFSLNLTVLK